MMLNEELFDRSRDEWVAEVAVALGLVSDDELCRPFTELGFSTVAETLELAAQVETQRRMTADPEKKQAQARSEATLWVNGIYGSAQAKVMMDRRPDNNTKVPEKKRSRRSTRSQLIAPNNKERRQNRRTINLDSSGRAA